MATFRSSVVNGVHIFVTFITRTCPSAQVRILLSQDGLALTWRWVLICEATCRGFSTLVSALVPRAKHDSAMAARL